MSTTKAILTVAIIAAVTVALRFLPFLVFGKRRTPRIVMDLGKVLPYAIMGMLCVFCLRGISFDVSPYGIPELISCVLVVLLHVWKRNTLISVIGGTACYMALLQFVF